MRLDQRMFYMMAVINMLNYLPNTIIQQQIKTVFIFIHLRLSLINKIDFHFKDDANSVVLVKQYLL